MNKSTKKKKHLKSIVKIVFGIVCLVIFSLTSIFFLKKGLNNFITKTVYYNEESNLNYKVYLNENEYFDEPYLGEGLQYISDLINHIELNLDYKYSASNMFNYNYDYGISAKLVVTEKNDAGSILYQVDDELYPETTKSLKDATTFNINETVNVDYKKYNDLVSEFKRDYTLSVDSNLYILFYVKMNGSSKMFTKDIANTQKMSVTIPMAKQTIKIDKDYTAANNSNYIDQVVKQDNSTVIYLAIAALSVLMVISSVIWTLRLIIKREASKSYYEKNLAKIMHDYNQIIVNSKVLPELEDYDVVEVESFDEILDAKNNTDKSIVFYEIEEGELAAFLVIDTRVVYVFYLKNEKVVDKR